MADAVALGTPLRLVGRPLPRHDARDKVAAATAYAADWAMPGMLHAAVLRSPRSEEHTSELQSRLHLVCRLLLEKKKKNKNKTSIVASKILKRTNGEARLIVVP